MPWEAVSEARGPVAVQLGGLDERGEVVVRTTVDLEPGETQRTATLAFDLVPTQLSDAAYDALLPTARTTYHLVVVGDPGAESNRDALAATPVDLSGRGDLLSPPARPRRQAVAGGPPTQPPAPPPTTRPSPTTPVASLAPPAVLAQWREFAAASVVIALVDRQGVVPERLAIAAASRARGRSRPPRWTRRPGALGWTRARRHRRFSEANLVTGSETRRCA